MPFLENYFAATPAGERRSAAIAYLAALDHLQATSPIVAHAILQELKDQRTNLKLIASENFSSLAVQLAMGNLLTDKYAEGKPHHRFYAGCDNIDLLEEQAQGLLKAIFGCDHAYVQPSSGADANMLAFWAVLVQRIQSPLIEKLGAKNVDALTPDEYERVRQELWQQRLLAMSLNSGGHLTHGYRHNVSSKMMRTSYYEVDPTTEQLDYGAIHAQAQRDKPLILLAGYSAHTRRLNFATLRTIADEVGAVLMVDMAHFAGLVAGKVFKGDENPIPFAHIVTSTTHKTLRGPRGGFVLCTEEFREVIDKACPLLFGGPQGHVIAAKVVAFQEANTSDFCLYAHKVVENARLLAARLSHHGLRLVSGGTDNHQVIIDLSSLNINGRQAELALRASGMTSNRNAIPYDKNPPFFPGGMRFGTSAMTTLGFGKADVEAVADCIWEVLSKTKAHPENKSQYTTQPEAVQHAREVIGDLLHRHPLYPEIIV